MLGLTLANFAKGLFNGENKAKRQERKQARKELKEAAKQAKDKIKTSIETGGKAGAGIGAAFGKVSNWFEKNKEWLLPVLVVVFVFGVAWYMLKKRKGKAPRRRRSTTASSGIKARMARVRAFRKKRK